LRHAAARRDQYTAQRAYEAFYVVLINTKQGLPAYLSNDPTAFDRREQDEFTWLDMFNPHYKNLVENKLSRSQEPDNGHTLTAGQGTDFKLQQILSLKKTVKLAVARGPQVKSIAKLEQADEFMARCTSKAISEINDLRAAKPTESALHDDLAFAFKHHLACWQAMSRWMISARKQIIKRYTGDVAIKLWKEQNMIAAHCMDMLTQTGIALTTEPAEDSGLRKWMLREKPRAWTAGAKKWYSGVNKDMIDEFAVHELNGVFGSGLAFAPENVKLYQSQFASGGGHGKSRAAKAAAAAAAATTGDRSKASGVKSGAKSSYNAALGPHSDANGNPLPDDQLSKARLKLRADRKKKRQANAPPTSKGACFVCGGTDHVRAQCSAWRQWKQSTNNEGHIEKAWHDSIAKKLVTASSPKQVACVARGSRDAKYAADAAGETKAVWDAGL
jgi:hypothetical protein